MITTHSWGGVPAPPPTGCLYVLIADEAHYMQSMESQRTVAALRLADRAGAVILATGTPLKNARPSNLFPLLKAIKHPLAAERRHYEATYCGGRRTRFKKWDVSGATKLPELHAKLLQPAGQEAEATGWAVLRKTKAECLDLPEKRRVLVSVVPTAGQLQLYEQSLAEARAKISQGRGYQGAAGAAAAGGGGGAQDGRVHVQQTHYLSKAHCKLCVCAWRVSLTVCCVLLPADGGGASKAQAEMAALMALRQFASDTKVGKAIELGLAAVAQPGPAPDNRPGQVVVACCFRGAAAAIHSGLQAALGSEEHVELLTGETPVAKRGQAVKRFQRGESRAFVLTCGAGGVGLTLTAASTIVLVDRPLTPVRSPGLGPGTFSSIHPLSQGSRFAVSWTTQGDVEQTEDRLHRIGQGRDVSCLWLQAFGVCEVVDAMLRRKQKSIDKVLGETTCTTTTTCGAEGSGQSSDDGGGGGRGGDTGGQISAAAVLEQLFSSTASKGRQQQQQQLTLDSMQTKTRKKKQQGTETPKPAALPAVAAPPLPAQPFEFGRAFDGFAPPPPPPFVPQRRSARTAARIAAAEAAEAAEAEAKDGQRVAGGSTRRGAAPSDAARAVSQLVDMDFARPQAEAATARYPGNSEAAVVYLINQLEPGQLERQQLHNQAAAAAAAATAGNERASAPLARPAADSPALQALSPSIAARVRRPRTGASPASTVKTDAAIAGGGNGGGALSMADGEKLPEGGFIREPKDPAYLPKWL
eukprot:SAG22_NODE_28_length_28728_cov_19.603619_14_plen_754_part_00